MTGVDEGEKGTFRTWTVGTVEPFVRLSKCWKVFFSIEFLSFPLYLFVFPFKSATLIATPVMAIGI